LELTTENTRGLLAKLSQALSKSRDSAKDPSKAESEPAPKDQALLESVAGETSLIAEPILEHTGAAEFAETEPAPDTGQPHVSIADPAATVQPRSASSYKVSVEEAQDIILRGLRRLPDFPSQGVAVTLYGSRPWNAMLTFAPGSTSYRNATAFRHALAEMISELRKQIEIKPAD
jgi:hypothetical protein